MTTFIDTNLHNMLIDTNFHFTCHLFVDHEDKHEKHVSNKKCRFKQCPIFSGKKNYGQVASTTCQASICGFVGMVIGERTERQFTVLFLGYYAVLLGHIPTTLCNQNPNYGFSC